MVDRTRGSSSARSGASGAKSKTGGKKGTTKGADTNQPQTNRVIALQKLQELTAPILERYGVSAFDELITRLESTVKEYTEEVDALFKEMVSQSREDYERMKSLLTGQEPEDVQQEEMEAEETMSEYEKRLERLEKKEATKSTAKK